MKQIIFSILLMCSTSVFSQNIHFIKSYGNNGYDYGEDIKQDIDTGYIATGSSSSFSSENADAFLLKVDSLGNFKWSYNYGGSGTEWGKGVVTTKAGGFAIGGFSNSYGMGDFDFYLVKTDQNGIPEYEKTYGGSDWDKAHDIIEMADSGFVMVGETYSFGNGNNDIYIVRTDVFGDTIWTRTYGGTEADFANSVLLDGDSLVVVGGTASSGNGMTDGIILKYHIDGTLGWTKTVGMEREDYFTSITSNNDGEYFLGGTRHYYFDLTGYLADFWIYNMEDTGLLIADTSITSGSHEYEIANGISVDGNDNIYFGGSTKSFGYATIDGFTDAFVGKLNNNYYQGSYIKNFGVSGNEAVNQLRNTSDRGFIAIGNTEYHSTGGNNLFILKIDEVNSTGTITVNSELIMDIITLSIEADEAQSSSIHIYPTLARKFIKIEGVSQPDFTISIVDLTGKEVLRENGLDMIDINHLSNGYYVLNINNKTSTIKSLKFAKVN